MRILIVDDSPTMQDIVSMTLQSASFQVFRAEHGVEALAVLDVASPDLIITDLNMYRMDGFEFVSRVRKRPEYEFTPILFLTTESSEDMRLIGRDLGATGWLLKPFVPEDLIRVVKSVLQ